MHPSLSSRSFPSSSSSSSSIVKNYSKDLTDEKQTTTLSQSPESQNPPSSHDATEVQHNHVIRVEPDDITFTNVQKNQNYSQMVRLTNSLSVPVEFHVRAGTPNRYLLSPTHFNLKPNESTLMEVRMRLTSLPSKVSRTMRRDVFHIRSESGLFVQRFHATWYPFGSTPWIDPRIGIQSVTPTTTTTTTTRSHADTSPHRRPISADIPTRRGQTAHQLPDSTLIAYATEGGPKGIAAQRYDHALEEVKRQKRAEREEKKRKEEMAHKVEEERKQLEADRLKKEEEIRQRLQVESELLKPFERVAIEQARQPIPTGVFQPYSLGGVSVIESQRAPHAAAAASSSLSSSVDPVPSLSSLSSSSSFPSSRTVSSKEYLALSQECRRLQSSLDMTTHELQQSEFQYSQLELEYKFLLQRLETLQTNSTFEQQHQQSSTELASILQRDRQHHTRQQQHALQVLRAKDDELTTLRQLLHERDQQLQSVSYDNHRLEAEIETARSNERRWKRTIAELEARLEECQKR